MQRMKMVFTEEVVLERLAIGPLSAVDIARSQNSKVLARLRPVLLAMHGAGLIKKVQLGCGKVWALAAWQETLEMFVRRMQEKCVCTADGCMLWRGCCSANGVPLARYGGRSSVSLRNWVYVLSYDRSVTKHHYVQLTCGSANCLNAAHMRRKERGSYMRGKPKTALARINMTLAARRRAGSIGDAEAARMRDSDLSDAEMAMQTGFSIAAVNHVRNGRTYRPVGANPFGILGTAR